MASGHAHWQAICIDDLPEELLAVLFQSVVEGDMAGYPKRRTTLALVSRRWNLVVQNTQSLWTRIAYLHCGRLTTLSLARSGHHSLDVEYRFPYPNETTPPRLLRSFVEICSQMQRWRTAKIAVHRNTLNHLQGLSRPAPRLMELALEAPGYPVIRTKPGGDLLQSQFPCLRHLRLMGLSIPWSHAMLSNLHTPELIDIKHLPPTLREITIMLNASPQLTILTFKSFEYGTASPSPVLSPPIPLPHLEYLTLTALPDSVTRHLLQHILSPPCSSLYVEFIVNDCTEDTALALASILRPFLPRIPRTSRARLRLRDLGVIAYCCHGVRIYVSGGSRVFPKVDLFRCIRPMLPAGSLDRATEVSFGGHNPQLDILLATINDMKIVHLNVGVYCSDVTHLLRRMSEPDGAGWLFPAMHTITIFLHTATPGALGRMVEARHTHDEAKKASAPVPITTMKVNGATKLFHAEDRITVQSFIVFGANGCRWE